MYFCKLRINFNTSISSCQRSFKEQNQIKERLPFKWISAIHSRKSNFNTCIKIPSNCMSSGIVTVNRRQVKCKHFDVGTKLHKKFIFLSRKYITIEPKRGENMSSTLLLTAVGCKVQYYTSEVASGTGNAIAKLNNHKRRPL